jgi:hypothetical protein
LFPSLQWGKLHLNASSRLKGEPPQGHVQFEVECGAMQYENKVETIEGIHLLNLLSENNPKGVQKPS